MIERAGISSEELHAFIDDELDDPRRAEIEALVARDTALSARVAEFRKDKADLAEAYAGLIERPLPEAWLAMIEKSTKKPRMHISPPAWAAIAAAFAVLVLGTIAYRQAAAPKKDDIIAEALAARNDAIAPRVAEAVETGTGPTVRDKEVSVALKMRVKAPDLSKLGYRLARLQIYDDVPGGHAVELVYRGSQDRYFTLYLRHSTSEPRFDQFEDGGIRVCIWQDDVLGAVMVGKMSAAEMQRLASLAYIGLTS